MFKPGQSGNPKGKPKQDIHVREIARQHTPEAMEILVSIMRHHKTPPAARAMACNSIIDRAYGKAPQAIEHSGHISALDVTKLTDEQLDAIAALVTPALTGQHSGVDSVGEGAAPAGVKLN